MRAIQGATTMRATRSIRTFVSGCGADPVLERLAVGFEDREGPSRNNNAALSPTIFDTFAQDLKMDAAKFKTCEASAASTFQADMQRDLTDATSVGVSGTPTFVIGKTAGNGLDGVRIVGAQPYAAFDSKLKELLTK